jgi:flagellar assembly protein FliH
MTSSYRATGQASVRNTPASSIMTDGAWAPTELSVPVGAGSRAAPPPAVPAKPTFTAEERAQLIDEGHARGFADGERAGLASAQIRMNEAVGLVSSMGTQLNEASTLAPAVLEENIAALAVIVARQIIGREVTLAANLVADLVRRALTEFPIDQSVRIRVHPLDLSVMTLNASTTDAAPITGPRDASWLADARVARGGCMIEGRDRIVDGRVDTALERAYHRMAQIDAS